MHDHDKQTLESICGGLIPDSTLALYKKFREAHDRIGNGPMHPYLLITICVMSDAVKVPVKPPHPFDSVPVGSFVTVRNEFRADEYCQGIYCGIGSGLQNGQVEVAYYGNINEKYYFAPERVRVLDTIPSWADGSMEKKPVKQLPPPEPERDFHEEPKPPKRDDRFTFAAEGTKVIVSEPGKEQLFGHLFGHDEEGKVLVLMEKGPKDMNKRARKILAEDVIPFRDDQGEFVVEFDKVKELVTMNATPGGVVTK